MMRFTFSALFYLIIACFLMACGEETATVDVPPTLEEIVIKPDLRYGYDFNQYQAKQLKIKGTSFC